MVDIKVKYDKRVDVVHNGLDLIISFNYDGEDTVSIFDKDGNFLYLITSEVVKKWKCSGSIIGNA